MLQQNKRVILIVDKCGLIKFCGENKKRPTISNKFI